MIIGSHVAVTKRVILRPFIPTMVNCTCANVPVPKRLLERPIASFTEGKLYENALQVSVIRRTALVVSFPMPGEDLVTVAQTGLTWGRESKERVSD